MQRISNCKAILKNAFPPFPPAFNVAVGADMFFFHPLLNIELVGAGGADQLT